MYDIVIIGGGPAGLSAAVNAKIMKKSFVWLASGGDSKKVGRAERIQNYVGLPDVSGKELAAAFERHKKVMGIESVDALATGVYPDGDKFSVLAGNESYECRAVILCTGVEPSKPVKGEQEFLGRGVSYCAVCDGLLYRGKNITVVCYDKTYEKDIEYLLSVAKHVTVVPLYKGCGVSADNAEILVKTPREYAGDMRVKRVIYADEQRDTDGVFVLRKSTPIATLLRGIETENGHIKCDRLMRTNIAGVFAAGDCTGEPYQYIKAAGEGNIALHSAIEYLAK